MKLVTNKRDIGCFILFWIFFACLCFCGRIFTFIGSLECDRSFAEESYLKLYAKDMPDFKENFSIYHWVGINGAMHFIEFDAGVSEVNAMFDLSKERIVEKENAEEIVKLIRGNLFHESHETFSRAKKSNCLDAHDKMDNILYKEKYNQDYILAASETDFEGKTLFFKGFILSKNSPKIFYARVYNLSHVKTVKTPIP